MISGSLPQKLQTPLTMGIAVVRLLLHTGYPLGVTQIAKELDMPKSSVHRLLKTLCMIGFVQQNEKTHLYGMNAEIFEFANEIASYFGGSLRLDEHLRSAAGILDASIYINMIGGRNAYIVCAAGEEGNAARLGRCSPVFASSAGKILLAQMNEAEWMKYCPGEEDEKMTKYTDLSSERFLEQVREARKNGYAWNHRESSAEHVSVAAVIREPQVNPPRLAVSILLRHKDYIHRDQKMLEAAVLKLASQLEDILISRREEKRKQKK